MIEKLDRAQQECHVRMFRVHKTTGKANIRALTGIMPYDKRHEELRAKWGIDMLNKTQRFVVHHAYKAHQQRDKAKSCFNELEENAL